MKQILFAMFYTQASFLFSKQRLKCCIFLYYSLINLINMSRRSLKIYSYILYNGKIKETAQLYLFNSFNYNGIALRESRIYMVIISISSVIHPTRLQFWGRQLIIDGTLYMTNLLFLSLCTFCIYLVSIFKHRLYLHQQ